MGNNQRGIPPVAQIRADDPSAMQKVLEHIKKGGGRITLTDGREPEVSYLPSIRIMELPFKSTDPEDREIRFILVADSIPEENIPFMVGLMADVATQVGALTSIVLPFRVHLSGDDQHNSPQPLIGAPPSVG